MAEAIRFVLERRDFKAGRYTVGYQSCDDSTAQAGDYDLYKCFSNAKAYARNLAVIGVIGDVQLRLLGRADPGREPGPGGALAMISPSNTWNGLTRPDAGMRPGEPEARYPSGERNFVRIAAADHLQAVANATLVKELGAQTPVRPLGRDLLPYRRRNGGAQSRARDRRLKRVEHRGIGLRPPGPTHRPDSTPTRSSSPASSYPNGAPWFGISAPASVPTWRWSRPTASVPSRTCSRPPDRRREGCTSASTACRTASSHPRAGGFSRVRSHPAGEPSPSSTAAVRRPGDRDPAGCDRPLRRHALVGDTRASRDDRRGRHPRGHPVRRERRPHGSTRHHLPRRRQARPNSVDGFYKGAVFDRVITARADLLR